MRREKIRKLLQLANVGNIDEIHELFKETIGEFMENGLEADTYSGLIRPASRKNKATVTEF